MFTGGSFVRAVYHDSSTAAAAHFDETRKKHRPIHGRRAGYDHEATNTHRTYFLEWPPPLTIDLFRSQVAMSKYRSVDVGNTLFGKVKLDPACIACDRPFGPASQASTVDSRSEALYSTPSRSGG